MMRKKSTKLVIFFGAFAVFFAWGTISLSSAQADSRPDLIVKQLINLCEKEV